jgi:hypothetical protein
MPAPSLFDYAVVRVVPRVERGEFVNVGVVLFCRTRRFLQARIALDEQRLLALAPGIDVDDVRQHLQAIALICEGDPAGGPIAQLPQPERFHWLVAPRSAIIRTSSVHPGLCDEPATVLERLLETMVQTPVPSSHSRGSVRNLK